MTDTSILLPNVQIAIASGCKLHHEVRGNLHNIDAVAAQCQGLGHIGLVGESPALADVKTLVTHHGAGVYSIPYLSPEYCDELVAVFSEAGYNVNPEEEPPAQIPEIVLKYRSKPLHDCLAVLWENVAVPLAHILWNLNPSELGSIQAAQYSPESQPGTVFHHDYHSDVTLVVNLGTEFEGGGTAVAPGLHEQGVTLAPLPKGHAMFFRGKTQLHRGLPVTDGVRTLLVHWANLA